MKKLLLLSFVFLSIFTFTACKKADDIMKNAEQAAIDSSEEIINAPYIGNWERVNASLNGKQLEMAPATITIEDGKYISSSASCTVTGDLVVNDDNMDIFITNNTCPTKAQPIENYIFTYYMEHNNEQMVLTNTQFGGTMVEIYEKVVNEDDD